MRAKLTFQLPEDEHDFRCSSAGKDLSLILWSIQQDIHKLLKYMEDEDPLFTGLSRAQQIVNNHMSPYWDLINEG